MNRKIFTAIVLLFLSSGLAKSQTTPYVVTVPYITGLNSPVVVTNCGDERLFIVEQTGYIRISVNGVLNPTPFLDIDARVKSGGEQGFLGLAFHPKYKENGYFYVDYTNNSGNTIISRFSVDPADSNAALPNSELILLNIPDPYSNHNGGNLIFGPDGYLYAGMGDGGSAGDPQNRAQNPAELLGKMLRIDVNHGLTYTIPPRNPFIDSTAYRPEIWSKGVRNPWRWSFDRMTGDLWIGDVGQGSWEEVDFQPASSLGGENWGWRCYEGTAPYNTAGCQGASAYVQPVYQFSHSNGCSITGGFVYRGALYGNLYGHYLFTDYCTPQIRSLTKNDTIITYYSHSTVTNGGLSSFGEDVNGEMYVCDLTTGSVRKIQDTTSCAPVASLALTDTIDVCDTVYRLHTPYNSNFMYSWVFNSTALPDTGAAITVTQSGEYSVFVYNLIDGCGKNDTVYVNLKGLPDTISWSGVDTLYCTVAADVLLNATPAGGIFYGAGVTDSIFSPAAADAGYHVVMYEVASANGCISRMEKEIHVVDCTVLPERESNAFSIAPNPVSDLLTIHLNKAVTVKEIWITDMMGRTITVDGFTMTGNGEYQMRTDYLSTGLYSLLLRSDDGIIGVKSFVAGF